MKHTKHLTVEQLKEVTALAEMLKHYQRLHAAIQNQLVSYIQRETGIDLEHEAWELDVERGVISHDSTE